MAKRSHEDVNYRTGTPKRRCGLCTMFVKPHSCTDVVDPIKTDGVCDIYAKDKRLAKLQARGLISDKAASGK